MHADREAVLRDLKPEKEPLNSNAVEKTKKAVAKGISLVSKIMKVIKIADSSDYSWAIV